MLIKWQKEYELGIDKIDNQHKQLVYIINQLYFAEKNNSHANVLRDALDDLKEYANDHFTYEEGIMIKCGYPGFEAHKEGHAEFMNTIQTFSKEMETGDPRVLKHTLDFLNEWLISHIQSEDTKYSRLVHAIAKGVATT